MARKTVVDVGNCGPDFNSIRRMLVARYDVEVVQCDGLEDTLAYLRSHSVALVTINRKLDRDYSCGLDVLRQLKASPDATDVPVMLVTNYPEHQQAAVDAGGQWGFGKLQLDAPQTHERLSKFLDPLPQAAKA